MSTIADIEAAIERLPGPQVDELARWLETFRQQHLPPESVEDWLERARGAAQAGIKTNDVMAFTRGEK